MSPLNRFIKDGQNIAVLEILQTLLVLLFIKNDLFSCFFFLFLRNRLETFMSKVVTQKLLDFFQTTITQRCFFEVTLLHDMPETTERETTS